MRMKHTRVPLKLHELRSDIKTELDNYTDDEQAAILNRFLQRLKMKRHTDTRFGHIKEAFQPPYVWLLIAGGIALPVMLYIVFIWSSLQLEG